MTIGNIKKAVEEAKKFIKRAELVLDEQKSIAGTNNVAIWGSASTSSLRRQSMELTRSLARMRKPWTKDS
jgi:hypothetical protein